MERWFKFYVTVLSINSLRAYVIALFDNAKVQKGTKRSLRFVWTYVLGCLFGSQEVNSKEAVRKG